MSKSTLIQIIRLNTSMFSVALVCCNFFFSSILAVYAHQFSAAQSTLGFIILDHRSFVYVLRSTQCLGRRASSFVSASHNFLQFALLPFSRSPTWPAWPTRCIATNLTRIHICAICLQRRNPSLHTFHNVLQRAYIVRKMLKSTSSVFSR